MINRYMRNLGVSTFVVVIALTLFSSAASAKDEKGRDRVTVTAKFNCDKRSGIVTGVYSVPNGTQFGHLHIDLFVASPDPAKLSSYDVPPAGADINGRPQPFKFVTATTTVTNHHTTESVHIIGRFVQSNRIGDHVFTFQVPTCQQTTPPTTVPPTTIAPPTPATQPTPTTTAPAPLPMTGSSTWPLLGLGVGLAGGGALLVRKNRRQEAR